MVFGLWTNRTSLGDFARNAFSKFASSASEISMAVAFFTERDVIESLVEEGCTVRLVVRLGYPTSPKALRHILAFPGVQVRYFTSSSFHPKLYLFDQSVALVGSANLTNAALNGNQEVLVEIGAEDPRLEELCLLFSAFWGEANVLTDEILNSYEGVYEKHQNVNLAVTKLEDDLEQTLEEVRFNNIATGQLPKSNDRLFIDQYQKAYQETVAAFTTIRTIYQSTGNRRSNLVPLNIEIDAFFSFVRDRKAHGEIWRATTLGWDEDRESQLKADIEDWFVTERHHFDEQICKENYPLISTVFSSRESLRETSYDMLVDALCVLHSFSERLRFFKGGLSTLIDTFKAKNTEEAVKQSLAHLLFDSGDPVVRMADLIFEPRFKLHEFGKSNVQEIFGWVGDADLPIVNARTTKILRYYGFDIQQIS